MESKAFFKTSVSKLRWFSQPLVGFESRGSCEPASQSQVAVESSNRNQVIVGSSTGNLQVIVESNNSNLQVIVESSNKNRQVIIRSSIRNLQLSSIK